MQLVDDVTDEWVVFGVLEHGLGVLKRLFSHSFGSSAASTAFGGGLEASSGVFHDDFALEFVECGSHVKKQSTFRSAGVDVLRQHFESNAALADVSGCLDDLCQRSGEPGEFPDDQGVAFTQEVEHRHKLWSITV